MTKLKPAVTLTGNHISPRGFPGGSDSKESACNVGDSGLIPGLGRSPGKEPACQCRCEGYRFDPWVGKTP